MTRCFVRYREASWRERPKAAGGLVLEYRDLTFVWGHIWSRTLHSTATTTKKTLFLRCRGSVLFVWGLFQDATPKNRTFFRCRGGELLKLLELVAESVEFDGCSDLEHHLHASDEDVVCLHAL